MKVESVAKTIFSSAGVICLFVAGLTAAVLMYSNPVTHIYNALYIFMLCCIFTSAASVFAVILIILPGRT
jgi:hypothetical protein